MSENTLLYINIYMGPIKTIFVNLSDTIKITKVRLQDIVGCFAERQVLIYAAKILNDNETLLECGLTKEATLHLVIPKNRRHSC